MPDTFLLLLCLFNKYDPKPRNTTAEALLACALAGLARAARLALKHHGTRRAFSPPCAGWRDIGFLLFLGVWYLTGATTFPRAVGKKMSRRT